MFVALPEGLHEADEAAVAALGPSPEGTHDVVIGLSDGSILLRTDGGRYVCADAHTRAWQTEAHADIMQCLAEAAQKKLKLASPVIEKVEKGGTLIYERQR